MTVSAKQSRVGFLSLDGKLGPSAFEFRDMMAHKWCCALYLHYWGAAKVGRPQGYPA
jgi:hypothetical protein